MLCFLVRFLKTLQLLKTKRKEGILYIVWGCLYILCVGLGTVDEVNGVGKVLFLLTALIFFAPGVWILHMGLQEGNRKSVLRIRIIAICSLALTLIVFSANVMAVSASAKVGNFLYDLLNLVSAPMLCSRYWIVSLFCWACLLSASFKKYEKKK